MKLATCSLRNRYTPTVYGIGFLGEGKYRSRTKVYAVWTSMLRRCYAKELHEKYPTYIGCTVCEEWHNFQKFGEWFDANYVEGYELDKDIKVKGNKVYSPDTCLFVSPDANKIMARAKTYKVMSPIGEIMEVYNMRAFCKDKGIDPRHMSSVIRGKRKHHRGWTLA